MLGEASEDRFGYASSAGDVNGDGHVDLILAGPFNDAGGADAGRAYIYLGGPGADAIADVVLTGIEGEHFGFSASGAGDVNGDGFDDVIVGAGTNSQVATSAGAAYVYYGGDPMDATIDLTFLGGSADDQFGISVSGAGDMNGDGFGDVITGAFLDDTSSNTAGRAYVFYGGAAPDTTSDLQLDGEAFNDFFGRCVSGAGDMNGDGYDDVVVGAPGFSGFSGKVYIFFGAAAPDTIPDHTIVGESLDQLGRSVSGAGDVNGDGRDDVIAGAHLHDDPIFGTTDVGVAHLLSIGQSGTLLTFSFAGTEEAGQLGYGVSGAGDVNGDGFDDVIVGALLEDAGSVPGSDVGRAHIFFGSDALDILDTSADLVLNGTTVGEHFGDIVAGAGDFTGDGFDDLIVGATVNDESGVNAGKAYVVDVYRYVLVSPHGGEIWPVGSLQTIRWLGPTPADLLLSVDGGLSYDEIVSNAGGSESNVTTLRVPHAPTRFAALKVVPADDTVLGSATSDSLFTIDASIVLGFLRADPAPDGSRGVVVSWSTDPGPEDLRGYRLERTTAQEDWDTMVELTTDTELHDPAGTPGTRYRLTVINGLGESLVLGETTVAPSELLAATPLPYRGGTMAITFATFGGQSEELGDAEVALFDIAGRRVRLIASGRHPAGLQRTSWDGRDEVGHLVPPGVYFLRVQSGGPVTTLKLPVVR